MKVDYNWLKDFVEITAPPQEIASRLALSGTNIAGIENNPHGAVIDAEITSNRPDCLGMLGIGREISAIYRVPLKSVAPKPRESPSARSSDALSVKIDCPELCGRLRSSSYAPAPGHPQFEPMMEELRNLFVAHQTEGVVRMEYRTHVYTGMLQFDGMKA